MSNVIKGDFSRKPAEQKTSSPHFNVPEANDFGDRLTRIRASLEKINRLMSELKKMSKDEKPQSTSRLK